MRSIRSFLLFNLFLSITLVSVLSVVGNLFLEHRGFKTHLDSQLTLSAYNIKSFLNVNDSLDDLNLIQAKLDNISEYITELNLDYDNEIDDLNLLWKSIQFQVWSIKDKKLLLKSFSAPQINLQKLATGFHYIWYKGKPWRAFALNDEDQGLYIIVLQRSDFRVELEKKITEDSIIIMLIIYPFLAVLIWVIVGKALFSLSKTTQAIKRRSPVRLNLIKKDNVPNEIFPLIDELNNLFIRLRESSEREKRFAADAAHELRTPLAVLKTKIQVELNKAETEKQKQSIQSILNSVDRSIHVVKQLLILSSIVPEASINAPETFKLSALAAEIIVDLIDVADQKQISLALNDPVNAKLHANKTAIAILLRNLIDNAIRYSDIGGKVDVNIKVKSNQIILEVVDNGPGISDKSKSKVLDRFYRVLGNKSKGSGLGLSIVKQIVDLHKARLELLDNKPDGGLLVKITFPANDLH